MKATAYKNVKEIIDNVKLTGNESVIVMLLNHQLKSYFGETFSDIDCNDIAELLKWNVKTVKGVIGSLVKKNICGTYDTGTGYEVVNFVNQAEMSFYHFKVEEVETPAAVPTTTKPSAHTIGEIHKNGLWVWQEYKPGKFDWRIIKGATPAPKATKDVTIHFGTFTKDGFVEESRETVRDVPTTEVPEVESHPNELTLEQFSALCRKSIKSASKKFFKNGSYFSNTADRMVKDDELDKLKIIMDVDAAIAEGIFHYFNQMYSPFDVVIKEVGKDVEDVKSRNIHALMAAKTITHYKGSFKVIYKNNLITVSRLFSKDTTLSVRDINSFM